nr:hypothetical protein [Candidatus Sigynarchaeota archaeon]
MTHSGTIPAQNIRPGEVIYRYTPADTQMLSGFYAQLQNGIPPQDQPIEVGIRVNHEQLPRTIRLPVFPAPLNLYTRQNRKHTVPLDIALRYPVALNPPRPCKSGDEIQLFIVSCGKVASGVSAGLQFQGTWNLADFPAPFRETRGGGPISRIAWGPAETIVTGNQIQFDPLCAPQNNSGIIRDPDGTLYQVTAFYSVDEQYGGGRKGSISRLYGFRRSEKPGSDAVWEPLGCLVDPCPMNLVYAGDPFVFRDLDGTPCIAFTTADGTDGFNDVQTVGGMLLRSRTKSFAGPWHAPAILFDKYPLGQDKEARVICLRIFPRKPTKDYVVIWQFGLRDISIRALIRPALDVPLTHDEIRTAPVMVRNQEEGGGGFARDNKGYISTWQIPSINDPTGLQRLYEFDLDDPLNTGKWHPLPGSWGWNATSDPWQDGGETADAWSLSLDPATDQLYCTAVVWSATNQKNSVITRSVPWTEKERAEFRFGAPKVKGFQHVAPAIEYALGPSATLDIEIRSVRPEDPLYMLVGNSDMTLGNMAGVEISPACTRFISITSKNTIRPALGTTRLAIDSSRFVHVRLTKEKNSIKAWVGGHFIGTRWISPWIRGGSLHAELRFKLLARDGAEYRVRNLRLTDGHEMKP